MTSFKIIRLMVLEKKTFKVFTIYGRGCHLGHVTWIIYINFCSPYPSRLHMKFTLICQAVSEKKMFENNDHIHVYSPGVGTDNPLGSIVFINSIIQSI